MKAELVTPVVDPDVVLTLSMEEANNLLNLLCLVTGVNRSTWVKEMIIALRAHNSGTATTRATISSGGRLRVEPYSVVDTEW